MASFVESSESTTGFANSSGAMIGAAGIFVSGRGFSGVVLLSEVFHICEQEHKMRLAMIINERFFFIRREN